MSICQTHQVLDNTCSLCSATKWQDISPKDAVDLNLLYHPELNPPVNEMGEVCPWPWEPQQLVGAPLGQYHCGYCGGMVVAGNSHLDYRGVQ